MTEKIDKILETVARIDERLKFAMQTQDELKREVDSLKRWKWTTAGGIAVLTFGAQYLIRHMVK